MVSEYKLSLRSVLFIEVQCSGLKPVPGLAGLCWPQEGVAAVQPEGLHHSSREELPGSPGPPAQSLSEADTENLPGLPVLEAGVLVAGVPGERLGGGGVGSLTPGHVWRREESDEVSKCPPHLYQSH